MELAQPCAEGVDSERVPHLLLRRTVCHQRGNTAAASAATTRRAVLQGTIRHRQGEGLGLGLREAPIGWFVVALLQLHQQSLCNPCPITLHRGA